ncbi:hypothetical protein J6590_045141 [Homalodisca vitripennis]|nr:hypothetical protein J6590_045141 [Homalodisca vitripennis]
MQTYNTNSPSARWGLRPQAPKYCVRKFEDKRISGTAVARSSARVDVGYSCNKPIQERLGQQNDSQVNSQAPTLTSKTQSLSAACTDSLSVDVKVVNDENI